MQVNLEIKEEETNIYGYRAFSENLQSEAEILTKQTHTCTNHYYQINYLHDAELLGPKCISHLHMSWLL